MIMKWAHVKDQSSTFRPTILGSTRRLAGGPLKKLRLVNMILFWVSSLIGFDWRNERY